MVSVLELREVGVDFAGGGLRRKGARAVVRALDEISVSVAPGEALGVVGANGAGKTTLLSVAARGIPPTRGSVSATANPRLLLDLVGDLHYELSARDNVVFKLRRLGLTKRTALDRLDEVWDFAEIDEGLRDQPLRALSAGNILRLSFASSVVLEPKLLLVDEVLAVGDLAFQLKCAERIRQLRERGMALLFASHGLEQVQATASEVIWLDRGRIAARGEPLEVLQAYRASAAGGQRVLGASARPIVVLGSRLRTLAAGSRDVLELEVPKEVEAATLRVALAREALGVMAVAERPVPGASALIVHLTLSVSDGPYRLDLTLLDRAGEVVASAAGCVAYDIVKRTGNEGIVDLAVDVTAGPSLEQTQRGSTRRRPMRE